MHAKGFLKQMHKNVCIKLRIYIMHATTNTINASKLFITDANKRNVCNNICNEYDHINSLNSLNVHNHQMQTAKYDLNNYIYNACKWLYANKKNVDL